MLKVYSVELSDSMAQPEQVKPELLHLRRNDTSTAWGMRIEGGKDKQLPLFIATCNPSSIAGKAGVCKGDAILQICGTVVTQFTHQECKSEMIRAGNEVDLWVVRNAVNPSDPAVKAACGVGQKNKQRVQMDEGSIDPRMNEGTKFRNVMPKSYQMLEAQLGPDQGGSALGGGAAPQQPAQQMQPPVHSQTAAGGNPGSIFDRQVDDRSDYLVAQGNTIQKAYGQE